MARCLRCNTPLEPVSPERAAARVPPWIARTQADFRACPGCGRVYWRGSHAERMRSKLERWGLAR